MLWGPPGVADFFAIQLTPDSTMIMNVADLALWSGSLLLLPVVATLAKAIRAERRPKSASLASL
jgi:lipoprotein signal peptidase